MVIDKWNRVWPLPLRFALKLYGTDLRSVVKVADDLCRSRIDLRSHIRTIRSASGSGTSTSFGHATRPHPCWTDSWETGDWSHGVGGWDGWLRDISSKTGHVL
jgi:hypothetical protein